MVHVVINGVGYFKKYRWLSPVLTFGKIQTLIVISIKRLRSIIKSFGSVMMYMKPFTNQAFNSLYKSE